MTAPNSLPDLFARIGRPRILVLGDLILDRYTFGNAERVSPEAPVVVLRVDSKEVRLGGAASVALLLRGLEAEVTLAGVIGDDSEGRTLLSLLRDEQIDSQLVLTDGQRPTTTKERIIGRAANRHSHQIVRVDHETRDPISQSLEEELISELLRQLAWGRFSNLPVSFDAILISDYAKGVCTPRLLQAVIQAARDAGVPVMIDPARIADYSRYAGATLLKPNRAETELATGLSIRTPDEALAAARELQDRLSLQSVLVTLDRDGMVLVQAASCRFGSTCGAGNEPESKSPHPEATAPASPSSILDPPPSASLHLPTTPREVYDITGAGDMVLAALGLCLASQIPLPQAAQLANIAAGLEVEKLGVAPITREELSRALPPLTVGCVQPLLGADAPAFEIANTTDSNRTHTTDADAKHSTSEGANTVGCVKPLLGADAPALGAANTTGSHPKSKTKLIDLPTAVALAAACRAQKKTLVLTNGCFDLLHVGHVTMLEEAAALGDVLIVAINSDASVRNLKGPSRPIVPEHERAQMLAALGCVNHVLIFDEPTPHRILKAVRPDRLTKGGTTREIIGHEVVEAYGGRVIRLAETPGISTTALLARACPPLGRGGQGGAPCLPASSNNTNDSRPERRASTVGCVQPLLGADTPAFEPPNTPGSNPKSPCQSQQGPFPNS